MRSTEGRAAESPVNILLVDDQPANLLALEAILAEPGQNLVRASSGEEALRRMQYDDFAVVLLDVYMPGLDGFETAGRIRRQERTKHTPIIFLTAKDSDDPVIAEAYRLGAVDYLVKPLIADILRAKVGVFVELARQARQIHFQAEQLRLAREEQTKRRAEAAVRSSEGRKAAILEAALDAIITMDSGGRVVEWNPAAESIFGYRREAVIGRDMAELIVPPSLRPRHYQGLAHFLATGEGPALRRRLELTALRADGTEFPIELAIAPISAADPILFTAYIRDITSVKQAEQALRASASGCRSRSRVSATLSLPRTLPGGWSS